MRPSIALNTHREAIRAIALRHRVTDVRVFGSALHGNDADGSDLDIAKIQLELAQLLHIPVDVLTPNALPAKFRAEVLAQAQAL